MHAFARRLTRALPNSTRAEIPGAAHAGHFDQPLAFAAAIRGAADRAPARERS
jgi:pimeloyl-ACP methyl ester carboxylesterase